MRWGYFWAVIVCIIISGCAQNSDKAIVNITDFELSPDEDKIVFSAVTPVGNSDIWVMDIGGTNLKKLSFKDRSPSNHIAKFFKRHRWRNFFEIDMHSPEWTKDGKVAFCEEITKHDIWGSHTVGLIYWTINPDGTKKRRKAAEDEIVAKKPFDPINRFDMQDESGKHRKKIFLRDNSLWVLDFGENTPKRLVDN